MTKKVFALDTQPGIQRDGTIFDKLFYVDGQWVRFQRGRPRKIGGYREISNALSGISRGIYVDSKNGYNTIFNGYQYGIQSLTINNNGVGAGILDFNIAGPIVSVGSLVGGSGYTNGTYTNIPLTGIGTGVKATLVVAANSVSSVTITSTGNGYLVGDTLTCDPALIGKGVQTYGAITGGSLYADGTYLSVPLTGGTGTGATANITVSGNTVTGVVAADRGVGYTVGDSLTAAAANIGGSSGIINTYGNLIKGSYYTPGTYSNISFTGGTGSGAVGAVVVTTNSITSLKNIISGSNYTNGSFPNVALTGGTGTGAIATITVSGGNVVSATITYGGNNYTANDVLSCSASSIGKGVTAFGAITGGSGYVNGIYPNVTLTGGTGTGARATITVSGGIVIAVSLTYAGVGYTAADSLTTANTNLGGSGAGFNVAVSTVASSSGFQCEVAGVSTGGVGQVTLTNDGAGYSVGDVLSAPADDIGGVTGIIGSLGGITGGGFYTNSTTASCTAGSISGTVLTVGGTVTGTFAVGQTIFGTGVTADTVITSLGSGSGGAGTYNINNSQTVGSTTINAIGIFRNTPLTGGSGTGATANIIISGNKVSAVQVVNPGVNYAVGDSLSASLTGVTNGIASTSTLVGGSNYTNGTYTDVALTGGSGTGAKATITVASNAVSAVTITDPGQNYVVGDTLGAAAASIGNGINALNTGSLAGGSNYTNGTYTNVSLTGGTGSGAKATIVVSVGAVTSVTVTSRGVGYTAGDTLSAAAADIGGVTNGISTFGAITAGSDYTDGTYTNVPLTGGSGTGARATITVSGNVVTAVTITTKGSGYTVGNSLSCSSFAIGNGVQTLGSITGGAGYTNGTYTNVPLQGGSGTGAKATVVVSGGAVTSVTITDRGYGYIVSNILSANSTDIGGTGAGFVVPVSAVYNSTGFAVLVATVVSSSGFSIPVSTVYASSGFAVNVASLGSAGGFSVPVTYVYGSNGFQFTVLSVTQSSGFSVLVGSVYASSGFSVKVTAITSLFSGNVNNLWQFDSLYNVGGGDNLLLAHPGQNLAEIDSTADSAVLYGPISGTTVAPLKDTGGANPTNNVISVSGGVVALHPYVFVYGNNGLIKNCSAGDPTDWNSPDANEVNVASTKIVKGLPVRGGSNAPSGLFWSLDSLIRVSFIGGAGTPAQYWRYDIISSQTSILSSQCVIEYDGIYYWIGVDRFLLYNGVVKEIPNQMNQNWFFDNLNYSQRQKVWATKVPRFGEIWWFYPRGNSEECNDAIIYNIRENVWYDAGRALGTYRSAGYFSQVFRFPVNASSEINATGGINVLSISNPGSGYTDGTYTFKALTGGAGAGATGTIVISGGVATSVAINDKGTGYVVGNTLTASIPGGSNLQLTVDQTTNFVSIWQHEIGTDRVVGTQSDAILSSFETNDLGWVSGGPSQPSPVGDNNWLRIERVEPDFLLDGDMELFVTGRPYAQSDDSTTGPYIFDANTNKIDMREQRRELRLKFQSNVSGGNYQLGKIIVSADIGDVRGY